MKFLKMAARSNSVKFNNSVTPGDYFRTVQKKYSLQLI